MLSNMTVIESQDSKDTTHSKSLFRFLPYQPRRYLLYSFSLNCYVVP